MHPDELDTDAALVVRLITEARRLPAEVLHS
jgi:hypothetical protein